MESQFHFIHFDIFTEIKNEEDGNIEAVHTNQPFILPIFCVLCIIHKSTSNSLTLWYQQLRIQKKDYFSFNWKFSVVPFFVTFYIASFCSDIKFSFLIVCSIIMMMLIAFLFASLSFFFNFVQEFDEIDLLRK